MKRHISFPEIDQFRSVVHNVKNKTSYQGKDAFDNAIHDYTIPCPVLKFEGTVKLHGTNAAVIRDCDDMWTQSRENLIEPGKDNAGFAMWVEANKEAFNKIFEASNWAFDKNRTFAIYGEWCGQGIQKGMAISQLPKMFVVFSIAIVDYVENSKGIMGNVKSWLSKDIILKYYET